MSLSFEAVENVPDEDILPVTSLVPVTETTPTREDSVTSHANYRKLCDKIFETHAALLGKAGIQRADVEALSVIAKDHPSLERFLRNNPIGYFTQEASDVLYSESMEQIKSVMLLSAEQLLVSFKRSVWANIQRDWEKLAGIWISVKRIEAKLPAMQAMGLFITDVATGSVEIPTLNAAFTSIHNERLQDLNKTLRENEMAFLREAESVNARINLLTTFLGYSLSFYLTITYRLVEAIGESKDDDTLASIMDKSSDTLAKLVDVNTLKVALNKLPPSVGLDLKQVNSLGDLINALNKVQTAKPNDVKAMVHPLAYNRALTDNALFMPMSDDVVKFVTTTLPELATISKKHVLDKKKLSNADVLYSKECGVKMGELFKLGHVLSRLTNLVADEAEVRVSALDKLCTVMLAEVKRIDKWVMTNSKTLPIGFMANYTKRKALVWSAVNNARLS